MESATVPYIYSVKCKAYYLISKALYQTVVNASTTDNENLLFVQLPQRSVCRNMQIDLHVFTAFLSRIWILGAGIV